VAQQAGTTRRHIEGEAASRLPQWALRAVTTMTALGAALAACGNSSDPLGNVASGPARGIKRGRGWEAASAPKRER
jgi:hypothetical protein